jgi:hypothetical protein
MEESAQQYSELAQQAYDAVSKMTGDKEFKIEAYRIILAVLISGSPAQIKQKGSDNISQHGSGVDVAADDWQQKIANKLKISTDNVLSIYYLDGDTLKLIVDHSKLPTDNDSKATQHLAALLAAGRQALGLDSDDKTPYKAIREICEEYGCYNPKNFATYIKKLGKKFFYDNRTLRLSSPAFGIAAEIAQNYIDKDD